MKRVRYVVWVNDDRYLYRTFRDAIVCASRATARGKDTLLYPDSLKIADRRPALAKQQKTA